MKLLFINSLYFPNHVGGAEVSVQILAETLVMQGHTVYVLSLDDKPCVKKQNGVIAIFIKTRNLYSIRDHKKNAAWKKILWHMLDSCNFLYRKNIYRLIKKIQPDAVNTNNIQGFSPYIWHTIKKQNIPLFHTMRDYYLMCYRTTLFRNNINCKGLCTDCRITFDIKKTFFHLPDAFIAISNFVKQQHQAYDVLNDKPVKVISNSISIGDTNDVKKATGKITIGFIGKVIPEKGIEFLLDEIQHLNANEFELLIAGACEDDYKTYLRQQYEVKENVVFAGKMNAATFYQKVHVTIVPSLWNEPFGRVPIESASFHTPVCIADKGGLKDLYNADCMWQFKMEKGSLASVLQHIFQNKKEIEEKSSSCEIYKNNFHPIIGAHSFIEFVREVINQKKQHA